MKRIKTIILSALLSMATLSIGASAAANVSYTDFSTATPANWTLDADCGEIKDGVMGITPSSTEWQILKLPKAYPTGTVVVEYDFKSTANKAQIYLQNPNGGSICRLQQVTDKSVQLQHGSDTAQSNANSLLTKAFKKDEWHHVKHVVTFRAAEKGSTEGTTSSVYLYDANGNLLGSAEDKICMNYWGYASAEDLRVVQVNSHATNEADLGTVYFDNFAVYELTDDSVFAINKLGCAIDNAEAVSEDISLKTTGYADAKISWESSNTDVITNDGKVTPLTTQTNVNMTATISYNGKTETVVIPVTVAPKGAHIVAADIYAFDFNDNALPVGLTTKNADEGYAGVRNGRMEFEKSDGVTVTKNPEMSFNFSKMELGNLDGKFIIEYDVVSTADKTLLGYLQASPNSGSMVRVEQYNGEYIKISTGGDGETAVNTTKLIDYVPGKKAHVKIIADYDNNRCSVYIDGVAAVENHHFMNYTSPGYLQVLLFQHNGTYGAAAVDNMVIYRTDADSAIVATNEMLDIEAYNITDDITLPTEGYNGASIAWASGYEDLLSNDGKLLDTPSWTSEFELTATISKGGYSVTKVFNVTVPNVKAPETAVIADATLTSDFYGNISAVKAGAAATANVSITKPKNSELSLDLIAAVYDADNTLKSIEVINEEINTARVTDNVSIEITNATDNDDYVVIYAWDSISGMVPLKGEQTIDVE